MNADAIPSGPASASPAAGAATPGTGSRRAILAALLAPLALLLVWAVVRGTWADTVEKNPTRSADGVVTQLYQGPDGRKVVRTALVIDQPIEAVWAAATDYEHFVDTFPYLVALEVNRESESKVTMKGRVSSSVFGEYEYLSTVLHDVNPERRIASWDQPGADLTVNRGRWILTPAGAGSTLCVLFLEIEIKQVPNFLTRDVLLSRTKPVLMALDRQIRAAAKTPK